MNEVQDKASSSFIKSKKGTVLAHTGIGKTFIFFKALYKLQELGVKLDKILFLAEVQDREYDLINNSKNFKDIYGKNPFEDFKIDFLCYQTAYKLKGQEYDFVCADEIHFALTKQYSKFFKNNKMDYLLGITATVDGKRKISFSETKRDILKSIAPICYEYDINEGKDNNTFREMEVYVIEHSLSDQPTIKIEYAQGKKSFRTSEAKSYAYWTSRYQQALSEDDSPMARIAIRKRAKLIYESFEREQQLKTLLKYLESTGEKTLVFGNSLDILHRNIEATISSRNTADQNQLYRRWFETGKTNILGSFKKLKQGANLPKLKNIVIHSYYSVEGDLKQRIGRARMDNDPARIFIFLTPDTVELNWFTSMMGDLNVKLIHVKSITELINKIK